MTTVHGELAMKIIWDISVRASLLSTVLIAWVLASEHSLASVRALWQVFAVGGCAAVICLATSVRQNRRRLVASGGLTLVYAVIFLSLWVKAMGIS